MCPLCVSVYGNMNTTCSFFLPYWFDGLNLAQVCPNVGMFASCNTYVVCIQWIRLLSLAFGLLIHFSSAMAVQSFWILAETGRCGYICWSGTFYTCWWHHVTMLATQVIWRTAYSGYCIGCCFWMNESQILLALQKAFNDMQLHLLSITYPCPDHNPTTAVH